MNGVLSGPGDIRRLADSYADGRFFAAEDGTPLFVVLGTGNKYVLLDEDSAPRLRRRWRVMARIGIWAWILALLLLPFATVWAMLPIAVGITMIWFGPSILARGREAQWTRPEEGFQPFNRIRSSLGTDTVVRLISTACGIALVLFIGLMVIGWLAPTLPVRGASAEILGIMLVAAITQLLRVLPTAPARRAAEGAEAG